MTIGPYTVHLNVHGIWKEILGSLNSSVTHPITLCNMIATNTITSTSVLEVDTAAPRATPSAK